LVDAAQCCCGRPCDAPTTWNLQPVAFLIRLNQPIVFLLLNNMQWPAAYDTTELQSSVSVFLHHPLQLCRSLRSAPILTWWLLLYAAVRTAEEFALHMIIKNAEENKRDEEGAHGVEHATEGLPRSTLDDDFSLVSELAFEDHDVLMLFDMPQVMQRCMHASRTMHILYCTCYSTKQYAPLVDMQPAYRACSPRMPATHALSLKNLCTTG
jgi:hypothetical protein